MPWHQTRCCNAQKYNLHHKAQHEIATLLTLQVPRTEGAYFQIVMKHVWQSGGGCSTTSPPAAARRPRNVIGTGGARCAWRGTCGKRPWRRTRNESRQRKWEKCAAAPRAAHFYFPVWRNRERRRSARATRPAPAARSAVAPNTALLTPSATVTLPGLQWYYQCITGFSFSDSRGESKNRVADKHCASCCARNSRAASHSPAGSVSQAGKWRKRREAAARAPQHTYPGLPRQHWILF